MEHCKWMNIAIAAIIHCLLITFALGRMERYTSCDESSMHYEFTECDSSGGRWRVSVPDPALCEAGLPAPGPAPTRVHDCSVSCDPGWYFNVSQLTCASCAPGTYSLGGGVHYDTWTDDLPSAFHLRTEAFRSAFSVGRRRGDIDCSQYGWQPRGDVIASPGGPCAAIMVYTVKLVKPGALNYTYQYTDESTIFEFQAQNDQCQSIGDADDAKWPPLTWEGQWKTIQVQLKTGLNVLHWKTIGIDTHSSGRPVMIKSIRISGVAYTSECTACNAGTFSGAGSRQCTSCPDGSHSAMGASQCASCDPQITYAPKGSPACLPRPPCSSKDFYEIDSACDRNNKTRAMYRWMEPQVCRDDVPGAVQLLPSGELKDCPPCNPGMHYTTGPGCAFCSAAHFSDGMSACRACPPSTAPNYGYQFQWWAAMPPSMAATCMSADDNGCGPSDGWSSGGDHIHSDRGHADDAYLVLSLKVGGFRGREGFVNGQPMEVGRISFTFELECTSECEFVFMEGSAKKGVTILQSWTGPQPRQYYSYLVRRNDSFTFSWAFQKVSWEKSYLRPSSSRKFEMDMAKVYNINVTNTIDGGASSCLPCPKGLGGLGCVPCPAGHYIQENTTECTACPPNTVVTDPLPYGPKSCLPCGPGLSAPDGLTCTAQCSLDLDDMHFDLNNISSARTMKGSTLFTSSGTKYYHMFNLSLCGDTTVSCSNNVSYNMEGEITTLVARACRSTIVPGVGESQQVMYQANALATQSVSLGDHVLGVTTNTSLNGITVIQEFIDTTRKELHFFFTTPSSTRACPEGRSSTITVRCVPEESGQGLISLPKQCPDGTCDGCNFHFLWSTPLGCPICSPSDLIVVRGECVDGVQTVHHIAPITCRAPPTMPRVESFPCNTPVPFVVQIGVLVTVIVAFMLFLLLFCLWNKNRNLEYKYMKLVAKANSKDGVHELPPAESCALDDGEEEEFQFQQSRPTGFFGKLRGAKTSDSSAMMPMRFGRHSPNEVTA